MFGYPNYPRGNTDITNLDYILNEVKRVVKEWGSWSIAHQIKFANPIEWNPAKYYPMYTIVLDSSTGDTYISKDNVPAGVDISNSDFWFKIGFFNAQVQNVQNQINVMAKVIYPSGDETGILDSQIIQNAINESGNVLMAEGLWYVKKTIYLHGGDKLTGSGNTKTIIHVVSDIDVFKADNNNSVDHLNISNMQIISDIASTHACFSLVFPYPGEYLGTRYSIFENLWIRNFDIGLDLSAFWCTLFNNCRFDVKSIGIQIGNACNNITFNRCQFYGDFSGVGVKAITRNSTENYGIYFYSCDFEKLTDGINFTATIATSLINCYGERLTNVIVADSCPNMLVDGGNFNGVDRLARLVQNYTTSAFNGLSTISNVYCAVNKDTDHALIVLSDDVGRINCSNLTYRNSGTGIIYNTNIDMSGYRVGCAGARASYYSNDNLLFRNSSTIKTFKFSGIGTNDSIKIQPIKFKFNSAVTTTSTARLNLLGSNDEVIGSVNLDAGTYSAGDTFTIDISALTIRDISTNLFKIQPNGDFGADISVSMVASSYIGEITPTKLGRSPVIY